MHFRIDGSFFDAPGPLTMRQAGQPQTAVDGFSMQNMTVPTAGGNRSPHVPYT